LKTGTGLDTRPQPPVQRAFLMAPGGLFAPGDAGLEVPARRARAPIDGNNLHPRERQNASSEREAAVDMAMHRGQESFDIFALSPKTHGSAPAGLVHADEMLRSRGCAPQRVIGAGRQRRARRQRIGLGLAAHSFGHEARP
jgi:hypothetical protein